MEPGPRAAAHYNVWVVDIHFFCELWIHPAGGHGIDLRSQHDVPRNGGINRGDALEYFYGVQATGVFGRLMR